MKVLKSIKRGFALICVMALALSLCACSGKAAKVEPQGKSYFSYFDTVSFVYSYAGDSAEQFNDRSAEVSGILGEYHRLFDIYHEYSGVNNLCTVNRLAGGEAVKVDKTLIDFMLYARELCEATNGEMDVTMGAVLSLWHDCREAASNDPASAKVPTLEELEAAAEHTGFGLLEIDAENCTLRLTDPEASLDVGALGKGYATERAAEYLESVGAESYVLNIGGNIRIGHSKHFITEACEYTNSFLHFFPTVGMILNIEEDHLDFFKDLADVQHSFREFALRTPEDGCVVANAEDANTMEALRGVPRRIITFGLTDKADVYAENIQFVGANSSFDIMYKGRKFTDVTLHAPGMHNVKNALAATAASICLGIRPNAVKYGLAGFNGAGRRFEFKGKYNGADVYDDYAHHPGELKALLDTVETLNYKRSIVVFQPHTYSRTAALFDDFVTQLKRPDVLFLAEIYAAREKNTIGISSADLAAKIDGARFFPTFDGLEAALRETLEPGDIVLTVGAGNVYKIGEDILADNEE